MEKKQKKFKFNIVDVIVIVLILAVVVFFAARFLGSDDSQAASANSESIRYVVRVSAMPRSLYEEAAAQLPAQMISNSSFIDSYIVSVSEIPVSVTELELRDGVNPTSVYHAEPDEEYVAADFVCEAHLGSPVFLNTVGSQEVRVGRTHYLKSRDLEMVGTVISVEHIDG